VNHSQNPYHSRSYMAAKATQDVSGVRLFVPCRKSYMAVLTRTDDQNVVPVRKIDNCCNSTTNFVAESVQIRL
jgi:hypothetical protein